MDQTRRQHQLGVVALCSGGILTAVGTGLLIFTSSATLWFILGQLAATTGITAAAVGALAVIHADALPWSSHLPRVLWRRYPPQQVLIHGLCEIAVLIAGPKRRFRQQEWQTDLWESRMSLRYALDLVVASLRMRLEDLLHLGWRTTCWVLSTDLRTWGLLIPVMVAGLHQITQSQGWGSALWAIPTVLTVHEVVRRLRRRWNIPYTPTPRRCGGRHVRRRITTSRRSPALLNDRRQLKAPPTSGLRRPGFWKARR